VKDHEEYRRKAAYCAQMADATLHQDIRDKWLRTAVEWVVMIPRNLRTGEDVENMRKWTQAASTFSA
jgi:hypothetical protein